MTDEKEIFDHIRDQIIPDSGIEAYRVAVLFLENLIVQRIQPHIVSLHLQRHVYQAIVINPFYKFRFRSLAVEMRKIRQFSLFQYVQAEYFFVIIYAFNKKNRIIIQELLDHFPPLPAGVGCINDSLSLIHISEPTRLGMISYAVFCLKKKKTKK